MGLHRAAPTIQEIITMFEIAPASILTGVPGWETEGEQRALQYLAQRVPVKGKIVEIGSEYGMGTSILASFSHPTVSVWSVDPFGEEIFSQHRAAMGKIGVANRVFYLNMLSELAAPLYAQVAAAPIDLLFIDGDHTTQGVLTDISKWLDKVQIGGVVVFHDTMAYTNMRPHEQHGWVQSAIESWRTDTMEFEHAADFTEAVPVDSMRIFVKVGGVVTL